MPAGGQGNEGRVELWKNWFASVLPAESELPCREDLEAHVSKYMVENFSYLTTWDEIVLVREKSVRDALESYDGDIDEGKSEQ